MVKPVVVRGSIVNLGFFLQAKADLLQHSISPAIASWWTSYPEVTWITSFFAMFGLVIALLKDVPDVQGDTKHNIPSFSVQLGVAKMFR